MTRKSIIAFLIAFVFVAQVSACDFLSAFDNQNPNKKYSITFETGVEDIQIERIRAKEGDPVTEPDPPERVGYRFDGWYLDNEPFVFYTMPGKNIRLVAKWTKTYTVVFDTAQGTPIPAMELAAGEKIVLTELPTQQDKVFIGWKYNGQSVNLETFAMPEQDITLTAVWSSGASITFNTGTGATAVAPISAFPGTPITEPAPPTRSGHKFIGWYYIGNNSQYARQRYFRYNFTVMPAEDITLYAKWMKEVNVPMVNIDVRDKSGNPVRIGEVIAHRGKFEWGEEFPYHKDYFNCTAQFTNLPGQDDVVTDGEIRGRGNFGSWDAEYGEDNKMGFRLKLGTKQSFMGLAESKHWVLHPGNEKIEQLFETYSATRIARDILDGIDYSPAGNYIAVYFNGEYFGVYTLFEQIRVGEGRVEITADYRDNNSGYLVELDGYAKQPYHLNGVLIYPQEGIDYVTVNHGWRGGTTYTLDAPDPDDYAKEGLTESQFRSRAEAIKTHLSIALAPLDNINSGNNWQLFLDRCDLDSFVDMYILHELYKNRDTGWGSFYLYKPAGANQKLYCTAPWDFAYQYDQNTSGTPVLNGEENNNNYFKRLMQNSNFRNAVKQRLQEVAPLIVDYLNNELGQDFVDEYRGIMDPGWPNEVANKRNRLINRIQWLANYDFE